MSNPLIIIKIFTLFITSLFIPDFIFPFVWCFSSRPLSDPFQVLIFSAHDILFFVAAFWAWLFLYCFSPRTINELNCEMENDERLIDLCPHDPEPIKFWSFRIRTSGQSGRSGHVRNPKQTIKNKDSLPDIRQNEEVKEELNVFGFYLFQTGRHLAGRQLKAWAIDACCPMDKPKTTLDNDDSSTLCLFAYWHFNRVSWTVGPTNSWFVKFSSSECVWSKRMIRKLITVSILWLYIQGINVESQMALWPNG